MTIVQHESKFIQIKLKKPDFQLVLQTVTDY